jgi:hypothetical protein
VLGKRLKYSGAMAQFLLVTHLGGLPEFKKDCDYTVVAKSDGLTFQIGTVYTSVTMNNGSILQRDRPSKKDLGTYLWDEIEAHIGTEEELMERLTLSGVALVDSSALFLMKNSKKDDYFMTMTFNGNHGLFKVENSANSDFKKVKAIIEFHQKLI